MNPARPTEADTSPPGSTYRTALLALAVLALAYAWGCMMFISRDAPWYRNTDMNMHNLVDALAINSNVAPVGISQPGLPTKYLLALDFRLRHHLGLLRVSNFAQLSASAEPLDEIRQLVRVERIHSRILAICLILAAAGLVHTVTRQLEAACLAVILLAGCSGLLFHGLLSRPDLLCVGFGAVLALSCAWRATSAAGAGARAGWLFLAGLCCGLSVLSKLPGLLYLPACYAWCWAAALMDGTAETGSAGRSDAPGSRLDLLPAGAGLATLWLAIYFAQSGVLLTPEASLRLRLVAVVATLLPVLPLAGRPRRRGAFLLARSRELALLGGGALAALLLSYGALRGFMTAPQAGAYLGHVVELVFHPDPLMKYFLAATPDAPREFLAFAKESPFLFAGGAAAVLGLGWRRPLPRTVRAFCLLLLLMGFGLTLLLSQRRFLDQFSVFTQVPLLLVWPIILSALGLWRTPARDAAGAPWALPLILTASTVLLLTAWFRVQPKYASFQPDATLPVNELTLTFIFDYDAHPGAYRQIMADHYGDRQSFTYALDQYVSDPAHR